MSSANSTVSQTLSDNELRDEVLRMKERYDNAYADLENAQKELEKVRQEATQDNGTAEAKDVYKRQLVMSNLDGYEDLINSIAKMPEENIDFYEVLNVLQQKNYFNIRDYQEIAELDQRKERLYQAAKKGEETPGYDKQFILLEYLFNIDKGQAENLTKKYAQDLPNLENNQENDELKQIISQIQTVLNCNDERSDTRTF